MMKRLIVIGLTGLLSLALVAPAHGASRMRYFEDRAAAGGGANVRLDVLFKNKKRKGKYTPRVLKLFYVELLPVTCSPGGERVAAIVQPTSIKLHKGKFVFPIPGDDIDAEARGTVVKKGGRIDGTIEIKSWNPAPDVQNCTTAGPRVFHARECRKPNQDKKLPICRF